MKRMLMIVFIAVGFMSMAYGQQGSQSKDAGWEKIGQTTINLTEDYGIFDWDRDREESISANDKYSAIKFRVKDAEVNLSNVEVEYDNGKKENLKLDSSIDANTDSKQMKLDTRQDLDKVTFNFLKNENAPKKEAVVEVWGLKAGASGMGQGKDIDVDVDIDTTSRMR